MERFEGREIMPKNIYREILARLQSGIVVGGMMVKVSSSDLLAVLRQFDKLEKRVEFLEASAEDTRTGIKKVLQIL